MDKKFRATFLSIAILSYTFPLFLPATRIWSVRVSLDSSDCLRPLRLATMITQYGLVLRHSLENCSNYCALSAIQVIVDSAVSCLSVYLGPPRKAKKITREIRSAGEIESKQMQVLVESNNNDCDMH